MISMHRGIVISHLLCNQIDRLQTVLERQAADQGFSDY
jgi:hypothetical protein